MRKAVEMLFLVMAAALQLPPETEPVPALTANQIMDLAIKRLEANKVAREGIAYTKTVSKGGGKGEVARMWIRDGIVWQRVLRKDGKDVRKPKDEVRDQFDFTEGVHDRYEFALADPPQEEVDGHLCWVLTFTPRGRKPANGVEEQVANRMSGKFWFDAQGFWLRRAEGTLDQSQSFRTSLIGVIKEVSFELSQTEVLGAIMPRHMKLTLHYAYDVWLFEKNANDVWTYEYGDWALQ